MNIFSAHMMLKQYRRLKRPRSKVSKETLVYTAILIAGTAMLYLQFTAAQKCHLQQILRVRIAITLRQKTCPPTAVCFFISVRPVTQSYDRQKVIAVSIVPMRMQIAHQKQMVKIAVDQTLFYCGLAIKSSAPTFAIAERAFVSSFAKPLSVRGSEAVWLRDMLRMTASCQIGRAHV